MRSVVPWSLFVLLFATVAAGFTGLVIDAVRDARTRSGMAEYRAEVAVRATGDILIGAVGPWERVFEQPVLNGIRMAVDEINRQGGVLGRQIRLVERDDRSEIQAGREAAMDLCQDVGVVAVLGHNSSEVSMPCATIYEYFGVLMITPVASTPDLHGKGFTRVFQMISDDASVGTQLAEYAAARGLRHAVIYQAPGDAAVHSANAFELRAAELGVEVADRMSYAPSARPADFRNDLLLLTSGQQSDVLFVSGTVPQAAEAIIAARALNPTLPILCSDGLRRLGVLRIAKEQTGGVTFLTHYDESGDDPDVRAWVESYRKRFNRPPGALAAQGYDSVRVLASAMTAANSTVPDRVAAALRKLSGWRGLTGVHDFQHDGSLRKQGWFAEIAPRAERTVYRTLAQVQAGASGGGVPIDLEAILKAGRTTTAPQVQTR